MKEFKINKKKIGKRKIFNFFCGGTMDTVSLYASSQERKKRNMHGQSTWISKWDFNIDF